MKQNCMYIYMYNIIKGKSQNYIFFNSEKKLPLIF